MDSPIQSTQRPRLPKRFALQLRGCYERLRDSRCELARCEALIAYLRQSMTHCQMNLGPISCMHETAATNVQIVRGVRRATEEELAYQECKLEELELRLTAAEAYSMHQEKMVQEQLGSDDRPRSTWVRWPDKPPELERVRACYQGYFSVSVKAPGA